MDTTITIKKKLFKEFTDRMWKGLESGAKRYAHNDKREATDFICDIIGNANFCLGQILKHALEYLNTKLMVALVKIANWSFLLYCKDYDTWLIEDEGEEV